MHHNDSGVGLLHHRPSDRHIEKVVAGRAVHCDKVDDDDDVDGSV